MTAMAAILPSSELERMASELKCPICLSLYKQAASLSCNHCFCTSCIVQSMKRNSCCPVCKVPAVPREVRSAPQMDSLVAILKGMETSAGGSLFQMQQSSQLISSGAGERRHGKQKRNGRKPPMSGGRKNKAPSSNHDSHSEIMNSSQRPKKRPRGKPDELVRPGSINQRAEHGRGSGRTLKEGLGLSIHGAVPAKEKGRATPPPVLPENADDAEQRKNESVSFELHGKTSPFRHLANPEVVPGDEEDGSPIGNRGNEMRVDSSNEGGLAFQEKEGQGLLVHHTCFPNLDNSTAQLPQLSPFFWLRDRVFPSQDEPPTQMTQTQGTARPLRPSFSDLKGSDDDDDQSVDVQQPVAKNELPETDSYDSDAFVWTQLPCSPELSSSPAGKQFDQRPHFKPKSLNNEEESLLFGRDVTSRHGVEDDDELRSPPKCLIEAPEEVEATQTPQLHQESSRLIRGSLSKCSKLQCQSSGGKVCRSLKPNGHLSLLRQHDSNLVAGPVGPNRATGRKAHKHEGLVSTDSSCEEVIRLEINLENSLDDVGVGITAEGTFGQHCLRTEVFSTGDATPERQQNGTSGGEAGSMSDGADRPPSCVFCGSAGDSEAAGPVVEYKDAFPSRGQTRIKAVHVHKLCAEWAPDVFFNEDEPRNLACEIIRGQKIKCSSCGMRGAVLGCCNKRCRRSFHYPCGRATPGCKWDEDEFVMFCPQHADCTFPRRERCRVRSFRGPDIFPAEKDGTDKKGTQGTSTGERLQRWSASPACKWVLCGSGLDSHTKGQLAGFASVTGASMTKRWSPSVTHVITGTHEHGSARRTLKFLMALLQGKWIVKVEWMSACITAGHIIGEDEYEVASDINGFRGGPKRSRALAAAKGPKLLEGLSFYFFGEFTSVSKEDLQSLIVTGRGVVLHRKPLPFERSLVNSSRAKTVPQTGDTIVLYHHAEDDVEKTAAVVEEAKSLAANTGAFAVPHTWLLDSVASCDLQPTS